MASQQATGGVTVPAFHVEQVAQIVEILICFLLCAFYAYQRSKGNCGWEVLYVSAVTPISYILTLALPEEMTQLEFISGQKFFWLRYASWYITCPIMLELLCRIVVPRKPSTDMLMRILVLDLLVTTLGVSAAVQKSLTAKMIFFSLASACLLLIYWQIYKVYKNSNKRRHGIPASEVRYRRNIMFGTFISWLIFPIAFLIGPETFNIISVEYSIVVHVVGDIFSKNVYSFVSWHFRNICSKRGSRSSRKTSQEPDMESNLKNLSGSELATSISTLKTDKTPDFDTFSLKSFIGSKKHTKRNGSHKYRNGGSSRRRSHSDHKHRRSIEPRPSKEERDTRRTSRHSRSHNDHRDRRERHMQQVPDDESEVTERKRDQYPDDITEDIDDLYRN